MLTEVHDGDLIYHYERARQAITGRSRASGTAWEDELVWAARGSSARDANVQPHVRGGWYVGLEAYEPIEPITLDAIRRRADSIRSLRDSLSVDVGGPLYFLFEISSRRSIRPMQGYLFKLPRACMALFNVEPLSKMHRNRGNEVHHDFGQNYREADETIAIATRDPFTVDPALVERGYSEAMQKLRTTLLRL